MTINLRNSQIFRNLIIVAMIGIALFPTWILIAISVKNTYQFDINRWGMTFPFRLGNFSAAWEMVNGYMLNTVFVAGTGLLGVLIMSLIGGHVFAVLRFRLKEKLFLLIIALLSVPFVLAFIPQYLLYNNLGLVNSRLALIIPNLANGPVFGIFLMRTAIAGIPKELYEASRVDGANVFQDIYHVSLPLSLPAIATLSVFNFLGTWNWFLWPLVMITEKSKQLISVGLAKFDNRVFDSWGPEFAAYIIGSIPLVILFVYLGKYYVAGMVSSGLKM